MFDNLFRLDKKLAVVTGAGNGLGRSFALGLAAFGANVICADRNLEGAEETAGLAKQSRLAAEAMHNDVADEVSVDALWGKIKERYGRVDILVNNAGIATASGRTHEFSIADWDRLMAINLRGVFLTTRRALQLMLPGPGSIINIASVAALRGYYPGFVSLQVNYSTAKAGLIGFTRQVAAEYAKEKIRVNAIAPGLVETKFASALVSNPMLRDHIVKRTPLARHAQPAEIAGAAVYLLSDAASFTTGSVIVADGGFTSS